MLCPGSQKGLKGRYQENKGTLFSFHSAAPGNEAADLPIACSALRRCPVLLSRSADPASLLCAIYMVHGMVNGTVHGMVSARQGKRSSQRIFTVKKNPVK